jgi:hypothetical protein
MKNKKNIFIVKKKENENELYFHIRKIFIETFCPKTLKDFKLYELYSHIFINITFLNCRYNKNTEKFIKKNLNKFEKNLHKYF